MTMLPKVGWTTAQTLGSYMDDELATPACRIRFRIVWMKSESGELRLESGRVAFTSENGRSVFSAPLEEVRASFPKVIFPIPCFGSGVKLAVHGKTYRLSFVPVQYIGWTNSPGGGGFGGGGFGPTWSMSLKDFKPARAAVRQWRAALEKPANGGH